jgi:hypothetical protein
MSPRRVEEREVMRWFHSAERGTWHELVAENRWDAIQEGLDYYEDNEDFYICRAEYKDFPYDTLFDVSDMAERMIEAHCDIWHEDQDSIFEREPTQEQYQLLVEMLCTTFKEWEAKENIKLALPWSFEKIEDEEHIEPDYFCWVWTRYRGVELGGW